MAIDLDALRARNAARRAQRASISSYEACLDDIDALLDALDSAHRELQLLKDEHADLEGSAEIWASLYAASVHRANAAEAQVQEKTAEIPALVQRYYAALDTIAVLTEAVESAVRDCLVCAAGAVNQEERAGISERCGKCSRALAALQAAAAKATRAS
jgi:hypothetical protein